MNIDDKYFAPRHFTLEDHVRESNKIEGIFRDPTPEELDCAEWFLDLEKIEIEHLEKFVSVHQPGARLRDKVGLNVRVGPHLPPAGSPKIRKALQEILDTMDSPFETHMRYETLHPFTDGNGRSGRILWLWMIGGQDDAPLGFLHHWYYTTLQKMRS